jgi:hypothetical protein
MSYTVFMPGTGCYSTGNAGRSDDGQPDEEIVTDTYDEALEAVGFGRRATIHDEDGELVATVDARGRVAS